MVEDLLEGVRETPPPPKALIAPHAGYVYSGPVAASAYASLREVRSAVSRVVIAGPSHWFSFSGLAVPGAEALATPCGPVAVDRAGVETALAFDQVRIRDRVYEREHSLEVHLPFLQCVLDDFVVTPLLVGRAGADEVGEVLAALWGDDSSLLVISSDLSHYRDYETARRLDAATAAAIGDLAFEQVGPDEACGAAPIGGLLIQARRRGMNARLVDLRSSGDTSGPRDRVVGYGAFLFYEPA